MELLRAKKRLTLAQRGHKLLKDKQEELWRHILLLLKRVREKRREVEKELLEVQRRFYIASLYEDPRFFENVILLPSFSLDLKVETKRVLNLTLPELKAEVKELERNYGLFQTSGELEEGIERMKRLFPKLVSLASEEKALQLLFLEMEKTKRRVNALEYLLIPSLLTRVKVIRFRLAEGERQERLRLIRIKR